MDGMEDTLQGGRAEMRGFGGRAGFTPFARIFTGSSFSVFVVFVLLFGCGFVLFSLPVK